MEVFKYVPIAAAIFAAVWVLYTLSKLRHPKAKGGRNDEAPYKVEPADTAPDLAVPSNPKRSYTKRSKYWTDKRKKAVAAKARSKTKRTGRR
jgi:hypothetical protein